MTNAHASSYKGYAITTRWMNVDAEMPSRVERMGLSMATRFVASFSVAPPDRQEASWQSFPVMRFDSSVAAAANSRICAMASIDDDIAARIARP